MIVVGYSFHERLRSNVPRGTLELVKLIYAENSTLAGWIIRLDNILCLDK